MPKRNRPKPPNPIDVIEAAYELERDDRDWLHHLAETIRPLLEGGHGVTAYTFDVTKPMRTWLHDEILLGTPSEQLPIQRAFQMCREGPESEAMHVYPEPLAALDETLRRAGLRSLEDDPVAAGFLAKLHARDTVAFRTVETGGRGICIAAFTDDQRHIEHRTAALWARVAAHVAAARRLRDALREAPQPDAGIEAVLTPSGKVEHAEGEGATRPAREALREAVARAEAARGRLRRRDPVRATTAWAALVSGRWTLVDRYEAGGRRYLVARRNEHGVRDPRALSPRERAVVNLALLGKTNRLIAYELGISPSAVATYLSDGMRKLGVSSRVELIRLVRDLGG